MSGINYRLVAIAISILVICGSSISIASLFYSPFHGWDVAFDIDDQLTLYRKIIAHAVSIVGALALLPVTTSNVITNEQRKMLLLPLPFAILLWAASSVVDIVAIVNKTKIAGEMWLEYIVIMTLGLGILIRLLYIVTIAYYYDYLSLFAHAHDTEAAQTPLSLRDSQMPLSHIDLKRLTYGPDMEEQLTKLYSKDMGLGFPFLRWQKVRTSVVSKKSVVSRGPLQELTDITE